jgi:leucyl aminopeptidase
MILTNLGRNWNISCVTSFADEDLLKLSEACMLRYPKFEDYKNEKTIRFKNITFMCEDDKKCTVKFNAINMVCENVFYTRKLVNMPPNEMMPSNFVEECRQLEELGVKVTVLENDEIKDMGCLVAVGQGSSDKAKLIVIEWKPNHSKDVIGLVGKGVTFDSGGLSIKPSKSMETMKDDMAGAATVLGAIRASAQLKINQNIVAVIPCVENMISGDSYRPGDILKSYSGKTVEMLNSDAEGRLILCDAISYIQEKYKLTCLIDLATLTGAIVVALGEIFCGVFCNNEDLFEKLNKSSINTKEKIWRMPLDEEFDKLMNSDVADIRNISNSDCGGGASTAAQFLQRFINNNSTKWAHLDIAGVSYSSKPYMFNDKYASGFGVRLLVDFISSY